MILTWEWGSKPCVCHIVLIILYISVKFDQTCFTIQISVNDLDRGNPILLYSTSYYSFCETGSQSLQSQTDVWLDRLILIYHPFGHTKGRNIRILQSAKAPYNGLFISFNSCHDMKAYGFERVCLYAQHTFNKEVCLSLLWWPNWLTFHFHTISQFRILNSEFRNSNSEFRILKFTLRLSEFGSVKYM